MLLKTFTIGCFLIIMTIPINAKEWDSLYVTGLQAGVQQAKYRNRYFGIHGNYYKRMTNNRTIGFMTFADFRDDEIEHERSLDLSLIPTFGLYINNLTLMKIGTGAKYNTEKGFKSSSTLMMTNHLDYIGNSDFTISAYITLDVNTNGQRTTFIGIALSHNRLIN